MVVSQHMLVSGQIEFLIVRGALAEAEGVVLIYDPPNFHHHPILVLIGISLKLDDLNRGLYNLEPRELVRIRENKICTYGPRWS